LGGVPGALDVLMEVLGMDDGDHGVQLSVDDEGGTADRGQQVHADVAWRTPCWTCSTVVL